MKSILERWQVANSKSVATASARQGFAAHIGAEQSIGSADREFSDIRRVLETLADPRPALTDRPAAPHKPRQR